MENIEKFKKLTKDNNLDAMLVYSSINVFYATGFKSSNAILIVTKENRHYLLTDMRYFSAAENFFLNTDVLPIILNFKTLNQLFGTLKVKKVGVESEYTTIEKFENLKANLSVDFTPLKTSNLRAVKTEEEVNKMVESLKIAQMTMDQLRESIEVGMTEKEIRNLAVGYGVKNGADKTSFDFIIASGINGDSPHWAPSDYEIREGELITIDLGFVLDGYCSDITRTFKTSEKINPKLEKIYNIVLKANNEVNNKAKAGMKGSEIDKIARDVIEKEKFGTYFGHGLGHSIGIEIHESPRLSPTEETVILEGMIMSNEPGIYVPSLGGVRIEDIILFKKDGVEVLTTFPKELIKIGK